MPKIQFSDLPRGVWRISITDLSALQAWVRTMPEALDGDWRKDFGSFILCGAGKLPKAVLEKDMKPFGDPIE